MESAAQGRRFYEAKRAGLKLHLVRKGMTEGHAERWLWAWEGSANAMPFELYSAEFWDRALRWIEAAAAGGQEPPAIADR